MQQKSRDMAFQPRIIRHRGITIVQKLDPTLERIRPSKLGLVLAGGAVSGGGFKAGGLKALDQMLARRRVPGQGARPFSLNDFDCFVGLSAGSVLSAVLSAGISPDELFKILDGTSEQYEPFMPLDFMRPNLRELGKRLRLFLSRENTLAANYFAGATDPSTGNRITLGAAALRMLAASSRIIPTGIFDPVALRHYFRRNMDRAGIPDTFSGAYEKTGKELYLTATDLNRGELVVFGHDEPYRDVPVSAAIAASCSLPIWYRPTVIPNPRYGLPNEPKELTLADGALVRTANIRVAAEKGCELIVCFNPFRRIVFDRSGQQLYDHGLPSLLSQSIRTLIGARLDLAKELMFHDPSIQADIVFVEPAEDDYTFFKMSALNYWSKQHAAQHGYESVRHSVESAHSLLVELLSGHGLELAPPRGKTTAFEVDDARLHFNIRESRGARR